MLQYACHNPRHILVSLVWFLMRTGSLEVGQRWGFFMGTTAVTPCPPLVSDDHNLFQEQVAGIVLTEDPVFILHHGSRGCKWPE